MEWVRDTLPWPSAQQDQSKLCHLPPPTVGQSSASQSQPESHACSKHPSIANSLGQEAGVGQGGLDAPLGTRRKGSKPG